MRGSENRNQMISFAGHSPVSKQESLKYILVLPLFTLDQSKTHELKILPTVCQSKRQVTPEVDRCPGYDTSKGLILTLHRPWNAFTMLKQYQKTF